MSMKKLLTSMALLAAIATGTASSAQQMTDVSTIVDYSDLNLATAKGQAALRNRLELAFARVCEEPLDKSLADDSQERDCKARARRHVGDELAARGAVTPRGTEVAKEFPPSPATQLLH